MLLAALSITPSAGHGCFPSTFPIGPFSIKTTINGLPVPLTLITMFATHSCGIIIHPFSNRRVILGSLKCTIEGIPAVRILDPISCGDIVGFLGSPNTTIG